MKWNEELHDIVRRMWLSGATYAEIGDELGISRSAAASRVLFLGLAPKSGRLRKLKPRVRVERRPPREERAIQSAEAYWSQPKDKLREAVWKRARDGAREALRA